MIPFDLERFKQGDIALTRDGREARFLYYNKSIVEKGYRLGATVEGQLLLLHSSGLGSDSVVEYNHDLVSMKPKTKTVYEWIATCGAGVWHVDDELLTEEDAALKYETCEYKKTGRKFEVEG
jgi:hypothetical protein